jgi:hypothetical protein
MVESYSMSVGRQVREQRRATRDVVVAKAMQTRDKREVPMAIETAGKLLLHQ